MDRRNFIVTKTQFAYYEQVRDRLRSLYPKFLSAMDREAVDCCGRRLDILRGDSLLVNTEHEMNLFYDYCLYHYKRNGLTVIERSFSNFSKMFSGEVLNLFEAAKNGRFAYLEIVGHVSETAFVVKEFLNNKDHLMIDNGLSQLSVSKNKYTIVTNIIEVDGFIITTGASTPVPLHTDSGQMVQQRFEKYLKLFKAKEETKKDTAQYTTDMYKICLHEDITGMVSSPAVPFGREALKRRMMASDEIH